METENKAIQEEQKEVQSTANAEDKPKKKLNPFIIIIPVVVIIILGLIGYLLFADTIDKSLKPQKVYKVGILNGYAFLSATTNGFKEQMTKLGYIEGKNIIYDEQKTDFSIKAYQTALEKFVTDKDDLIVAYPTEASIEGKKVAVSSGIPLVFANANVEDMNLINSIREPGNNLTGVRWPGPDLARKRLEIMLELVPNAKTIVIPYLKTYPNVPPQLKAIHEGAKAASVTIIELPVTTPAELESGLQAIKSTHKIDAILTLAEVVSADPSYAFVYGKFGEENKIPTGGALLLKSAGYKYESLFGATADAFSVGEQAAILADKVFEGIKPGTIPVVSAETYIEVNYKYATEMGITLNQNVLVTANRIIR
jgi:putative tryptophan/tyrosine transport system substrate-binding protein